MRELEKFWYNGLDDNRTMEMQNIKLKKKKKNCKRVSIF